MTGAHQGNEANGPAEAATGNRYVAPGSVLLAAALAIGGCAPRETKFFIDDHRDDTPATRYFEEFPECYYSLDAHSNVDIVARRQTFGADPDGEPIIQIIHIRRVWAAIPGQTYAEESMINATVSYLIVGSEGGASYEGGGFVTFNENRDRTEIAGELESSALTRQRGVGSGTDVFGRVAVTGTLRAQRNKREVVRVLNEVKRLFGPLPRYVPPPVNPDLR